MEELDFCGVLDSFRILDKKLKAKKISSVEDLSQLITFLQEEGKTVEEITTTISSFNWEGDFNDLPKETIISTIIKQKDISLTSKEHGGFGNIGLSENEIKQLNNIEDINVKKILYLLLFVSKWNDHKSGWIKYDRDFIFKFWGLDNLQEKEKNKIIQECCHYGLELRVVGSKLPIVCYKVNFRDYDNYIITIRKYGDIRSVFEQLMEL